MTEWLKDLFWLEVPEEAKQPPLEFLAGVIIFILGCVALPALICFLAWAFIG